MLNLVVPQISGRLKKLIESMLQITKLRLKPQQFSFDVLMGFVPAINITEQIG
jgi:hypothetical protein